MKNLETLFNQMESRIPHFETLNPNISKSNVGWHIEHCLLTLNGVAKLLKHSDPKDYKWRFNFAKILVLKRGKIPRGRAKSPEVVVPKIACNETHLQSHLEQTRKSISELESVSKDHYFNHPYFGKLKKNDTLRFLEIHTNHHLEIIEDIIK